MRAIVTGAAGFIGSTLVDRLIQSGNHVVGIDNLATGTPDNLKDALGGERHSGSFTLEEIDVASGSLADIFSAVQPDVVFHLAAQVDLRASVSDPQYDARTNILGTINVCEASSAAGVRRVVYAASGGSRYGTPTELPVPETELAAPVSPYAVSKLAGELYLGAYGGMYGLSPVSLALSNVYGPRQNPMGEAGVIAMFGLAALSGRSATIYGDGSSSRDYVFVDDVVEAFMLAAAAPLTVHGTFNIGTGAQTSVAEVHRLVSQQSGQSIPPGYGPPRTGELEAIALDSRKAKEELGWRPAVDIEEGVRRTVDWLQNTFAAHERSASVGRLAV